MLKHRHFISYFSTTLLYLAAAGLLFYGEKHYFISTEPAKEKVLQISLERFISEVIEPLEKVVEEIFEPIIEKKEPIATELIDEPKVLEKPMTPPEVTKTQKQPKKIVQKKKVKKQRKQKVSQKRVSSRNVKSSQVKRKKFWNTLRAKIDKHKSYPRMAKKRRMEGTIKAMFTILSNGKVGNISLNGPKIFHHSARNAIKRAFPVNIKKIPLSLPTTIHISLRYKMR